MNAVLSDDEIKIYDAYLFKESIKEIPGRYYDPLNKAWSIPCSEDNLLLLLNLGCSLGDELMQKIKDFEEPSSGNTSVISLFPMPIRAKPYSHQVKAFNFALDIFGIRGGDEI